MVILHNRHDKVSRDFVAQHGDTEGVTVLDWYNPADRRQWIEAGGTNAISAFPSVLFLREAEYEETDAEGQKRIVESGWEVMRTPPDLQSAVTHRTDIERKIEDTKRTKDESDTETRR